MITQKTADNGPVVALVETMLDKLAEIENERERIITAHPLDARRSALMVEVAEIDEQIAEITMPLDAQIAGLRTAVIEQALQIGGSVKGSTFMAVYAKGRESVDTKQFKGLLLAHPEYKPMLHVGEPSVSIRPVKKD